MKKRIGRFVLVMVLALALTGGVAWSASLPAVGGVMPDLSPGFNLPKPKDGFVIIQIFSMYCPYCQKDAPNVNRLYEKIQASPVLKNKMVLVGIGAGNSAFEVDRYRQKFQVRFPLYSDSDFKLHKGLGEPRTPYFIGVKIHSDGSHRIAYSRLGEIGDVDAFLSEMTRLSGMKP